MTKVQRARSGSPFEERFGFCRAVRIDDRVFVAGTAPIWPDGSVDPDPPMPRDRRVRSRRRGSVVARRRTHPHVPCRSRRCRGGGRRPRRGLRRQASRRHHGGRRRPSRCAMARGAGSGRGVDGDRFGGRLTPGRGPIRPPRTTDAARPRSGTQDGAIRWGAAGRGEAGNRRWREASRVMGAAGGGCAWVVVLRFVVRARVDTARAE